MNDAKLISDSMISEIKQILSEARSHVVQTPDSRMWQRFLAIKSAEYESFLSDL